MVAMKTCATPFRFSCMVFFLFSLLVFGQYLYPMASGEVAAELDAASLPTMYKGYFGESFVDEYYKSAGRGGNILGKWHPTTTGPDLLYQLKDGVLELHEVKASAVGWPGKGQLDTELRGQKMQQLSNQWIDEWITRVNDDSFASPPYKEAAKKIADARKSGRLIRIFDEVNLQTGEWRSSDVSLGLAEELILKDKMGPVKIDRLGRKLADACNDLDLKRLANLETGKVFRSPVLNRLPVDPAAFEDYSKAMGGPKIQVRPGILAADGKLLVGLESGAAAGILVFSIDAGTAVCRLMQNDILRPEFERKVMDAAVKGTLVGGAVAVAVVLGTNPAGWVVLAVGFGAYYVTDAALTSWHESRDRQRLNTDDLKSFGIESTSILDYKNPDSPLEAEKNNGKDTPLNAEDVKDSNAPLNSEDRKNKNSPLNIEK